MRPAPTIATCRRAVKVWLLGAILLVVLAGCAPLQASPSRLVVFAASSLTDAFDDIAATYEEVYPGVEVISNYAASSQLAVQILNGADADVFASANEDQMQLLLDGDTIGTPPMVFASNDLIVIARPGSDIDTLADLAEPGLRIVMAVPGVPIRDYTDQVFERMAADPAYGPAYRAAVYANLVSEEANVRQVVSKVSLGEADAALVYTSDVMLDVNVIVIPGAFNVAATYPIGVVRDAPNPVEAQRFVDFVLSERGQAILAGYGFGPIP
ncbi:MAG: molybdate ABC transporter substrate-binding protein [Chloroflexi bacterium]|nr:molybdate ABC transporter substrate-binding protein [Chloroflexota bacterium]